VIDQGDRIHETGVIRRSSTSNGVVDAASCVDASHVVHDAMVVVQTKEAPGVGEE
jgi:hypothetical protein